MEGCEDWRYGALGRAAVDKCVDSDDTGKEDWRYGALGRAAVNKCGDGDDTGNESEVEKRALGEYMEGWEDWRYGALGRAGVDERVDSDDTGNESEGEEDWRLGALGRMGKLRGGVGLKQNPRTHSDNDHIPELVSPTEAAVNIFEAQNLMRDSESASSIESGVNIPKLDTPPSSDPAAACVSVRKEHEFTAASLLDRFRLTHNVPSTPARSLSAEVGQRTIWSYWAQGYEAMPELFKLAVETWRRQCPHFDVRILDRDSVLQYVSLAELPNFFMELTRPQIASDCVRLALLSRYGGVWLDVSVILLRDMNGICWDQILNGDIAAAACYHPGYGSVANGEKDFVESWFLATAPGNPFFLQWRDLVREVMHNRTDTTGLLQHPLYDGLELAGLTRLTNELAPLRLDMREHLVLHAMFQRLIQKERHAYAQWRGRWLSFNADAADGALCLQRRARDHDALTSDFLMGAAPDDLEAVLRAVPLVKLTTPQYASLLGLSRAQLLDQRTLLGQLLGSPAANAASSRRLTPAQRIPSAFASQARRYHSLRILPTVSLGSARMRVCAGSQWLATSFLWAVASRARRGAFILAYRL